MEHLRVKSNTLQLNETDQSNLAAFIKSCELSNKNLETTTKAYRKCSDSKRVKDAFWQTPLGVITIGLSSFLLGTLVNNNIK